MSQIDVDYSKAFPNSYKIPSMDDACTEVVEGGYTEIDLYPNHLVIINDFIVKEREDKDSYEWKEVHYDSKNVIKKQAIDLISVYLSGERERYAIIINAGNETPSVVFGIREEAFEMFEILQNWWINDL